jgi:hemolysin activation/secretion protein
MLPGVYRRSVFALTAMLVAPFIGASILGASIFGASVPALAQISPSDLPGRELERFREPVAPRAQPGGATVSLPSSVAPAGADRTTLTLARVVILGNTVYRPDEFAPLYADLIGRVTTLQAVYDIAARITAKYGADGYVLSRAIVPPQELSPGGATIRIQIVEGFVDQVVWPTELSKYRDFFSYYADRIIADRPANIKTIERYLLLAGDLPGLKFKNSLKPSASQHGAATLVVEVTEKPIDALVRADNRGTQSRGPYQYFTSVTANNLLRLHDAFTVNYAGVAPQLRELNYVYAQYRQVLGPEGLTAFINGSYGYGRPGQPLDPVLKYKTLSSVFEAGASYPFIRQRERNLGVTALAFVTDSRSDILDTLNNDVRLRGVRVKVDADAADQLAGINQLNLVASQGINAVGAESLGFINTKARLDFTKFEATYTRNQPLFAQVSLLFAAYGQYAVNPLFSPEQCGYGGRVFGRGFDPSQILGDSCALVLGELRYDVPTGIKDLTQFQLYGFADRGWLHNIAPQPGTPANVDAASVGGGIRLGLQSPFSTFGSLAADLSAAKGIEGPRDDWRFFFIVTGRY